MCVCVCVWVWVWVGGCVYYAKSICIEFKGPMF